MKIEASTSRIMEYLCLNEFTAECKASLDRISSQGKI
jgi:hypothetical protein